MPLLFPTAVLYLFLTTVLCGQTYVLKPLAIWLQETGWLLFFWQDANLVVLNIFLFAFSAWLLNTRRSASAEAFRKFEDFWDTQGSDWLSYAGVLLVLAGAVVLVWHGKGSLERLLAPLAALLGSLGAVAERERPKPISELPELRQSLDEADIPAPPDGAKPREVRWTLEPSGGRSSLQLKILIPDLPANQTIQNLPLPKSQAEWLAFFNAPQSPEMLVVTRRLRDESVKHQLTRIEEAVAVAALASSIPPTPEAAFSQALRTPHQTLVEYQGCSTERVILAASLLRLLGHEIGLFVGASPEVVGIALGYHPVDIKTEDALERPLSMTSAKGNRYYLLDTDPESDLCGTAGAIFFGKDTKAALHLLPIP